MDMEFQHQVNVNVGKKMREIRKKHGHSQTQLGKEIGVTFQQVQKYERATNRLSAGKLFAVCALYKVEPNWFYADTMDMPEIKPLRANVAKMVADADPSLLKAIQTLLQRI